MYFIGKDQQIINIWIEFELCCKDPAHYKYFKHAQVINFRIIQNESKIFIWSILFPHSSILCGAMGPAARAKQRLLLLILILNLS